MSFKNTGKRLALLDLMKMKVSLVSFLPPPRMEKNMEIYV